MAKVPTPAALDCARRLTMFLADPIPPRHIDAAAHDARMHQLQRLVAGEGGVFTGYVLYDCAVQLHGIVASSTSGQVSACRNWASRVTLAALRENMAGDA